MQQRISYQLLNPATRMETAQFASISTDRLWVGAPQALLAMQRGVPGGAQQRIALPNDTTLPGDNYIEIDARQLAGGSKGRLNFEAFVRRIGGLPAPFEDLRPGELKTAKDRLGPYFWASQSNGARTTCVLALRRLDLGKRRVPGQADVLDIMLRNCVQGSTKKALAPIGAAQLTASNGPGRPAAVSTSRDNGLMLSPLAAPTPQ